jgi:hypothetical protein
MLYVHIVKKNLEQRCSRFFFFKEAFPITYKAVLKEYLGRVAQSALKIPLSL